VSDDAKLTALLHISTIVTVVMLAFLGVDSAHLDTPNYTDGMRPARDKAKNILLRLGLSGRVPVKIVGAGWWFRLKTTFFAAVICVVADDPIHLQWVLHCFHFCHRQRHIPLFKYFKRSDHQLNVAMAAGFSMLVMFSSAGAIVWHNNWFDISNGWFEAFSQDWLIKSLLVIEEILLVWLIGTGACMHWLRKDRLVATCEMLGKKITHEFNIIKQKQQQELALTRTRLEARKDFLKRTSEATRLAAEEAQRQIDELDSKNKDDGG